MYQSSPFSDIFLEVQSGATILSGRGDDDGDVSNDEKGRKIDLGIIACCGPAVVWCNWASLHCHHHSRVLSQRLSVAIQFHLRLFFLDILIITLLLILDRSRDFSIMAFRGGRSKSANAETDLAKLLKVKLGVMKR